MRAKRQVRIDHHALSDAEIAARCAARDPEALRHVIAVYNQRLFRTAWSILNDRSEAEEAMQAAYLSAFAAIGRFEGRSSLATWLTRILVNEALARRRAMKRRRDALEAQGVTMIDRYRDMLARGSEAASPESELARGQLRRLIEQAVAGLPEPFRPVFVLREIEGLSLEEIAGALAIPVATVKTRLLRARRRLREALAPEVRQALEGAFPFAGTDCAAMAERVTAALRAAGKP